MEGTSNLWAGYRKDCRDQGFVIDVDLHFLKERLPWGCGGQKASCAMDTLKGQFLVAMPEMNDERFVETVIYLVAHGDDGAMGLVVNKPMPDMHISDIIDEIELGDEAEAIRVAPAKLDEDVLRGGPVETSRGFVLHSDDYFRDGNSFPVEDGICLTATLDVLRAIAKGKGPSKSLLALGYCGWTAGQLENELRNNGWLTVDASEDVLFEVPLNKRYDAALASLGLTRATLNAQGGTA
jgi:putative transcriptional regulator